MSCRAYGVLFYKHTDHHLRQFGVSELSQTRRSDDAVRNRLMCARGSQSAKTRHDPAFTARGDPQPHAESRRAAFFSIRPNSRVYAIAHEPVPRGITDDDVLSRQTTASRRGRFVVRAIAPRQARAPVRQTLEVGVTAKQTKHGAGHLREERARSERHGRNNECRRHVLPRRASCLRNRCSRLSRVPGRKQAPLGRPEALRD